MVVPVSILLDRLEAIGQSLADTPGALGLLGLGSVGVERNRLDEYSDLDFFVIVQPGHKQPFLVDLGWLAAAGTLVYSFRNTPDGYKVLFADGVFCEFAVFELEELREAAYSPGRWVWRKEEVPEELCFPARQPSSPVRKRVDWAVEEALTNLFVGLGRYHRGEKLAAMRMIQGYAIDRLLEIIEATEPAEHNRDAFALERRFERRHPASQGLLAQAALGYEGTIDSAKAILAYLESRFTVNAALRTAVLDLCEYCPKPETEE